MAQLKSFKFLGEQEETSTTNSTSGPSLVDQEVKSEGANSSSSSASSYAISGGNLTSDSTGEGLATGDNRRGLVARDLKQGHQRSKTDEESTTISSNEEYQLAKHDIEEESEPENNFESQENAQSKPEASQMADLFARRLASNRTPSSTTPATPRLHFKNRQTSSGQQQTPGSPIPFEHQLYQSPYSGRFKLAGGDAASQHSFGRLTGVPTKHFEIRWHNINLSAERPRKISQIIAESPVFKLFGLGNNGKANDIDTQLDFAIGHDGRNCYSPPLKHKLKPAADQQECDQSFDGKDATGIEFGGGSTVPNRRPILTKISGSVLSGQLTAILGPSGVGKTMLLNSLTGRNTLEGTGRVDLLGGASKRMSVVTVPQADILPGKLTALEDLRFTSRLKNPQKGFNHERNIERIVRHLQMEKFLNTKIDRLSGGEARRLSIGRELLNSPDIMILDEPTSGLDANTCKKIISALRNIVEHSQDILDRPMSIIVTIHQPQQEVLNLFHRVYVMARSSSGTRSIYEGPPSNLLPTLLAESSLSRVCSIDQLNENPAIVALEVASGEYGPQIVEELAQHHERQTMDDIQSLYSAPNSPYMTPQFNMRAGRKSPALSITPRLDLLRRAGAGGARLRSIDESKSSPAVGRFAGGRASGGQMPMADHLSNVTSLSYASTYDADLPEPVAPKLKVDKRLRRSVVMRGDFISQTYTLMSRCWLLTTRDMFLMSIRILGFLLVAGGMVQIFSGALDPNEHQCPTYESQVDDVFAYVTNTKNRLFNLQATLKQASSTHLFFFHLVLCITMVTSALTGLVFPLQMRMFVREHKNGWYSPAVFITSQTLAELPVDIIGPTLALLITYPLCHQPTSDYYWRELAYIFVLTLSSIICKSQAQIVGAFLMDSIENSVFISCVMVTVPALLSGIAVRVSQMIWPLQILSYGSFLRYAFESLFLLRYGYGICPCDPEIVNGYPIRVTSDAVPPHLDNLARGLIDLNTNNTIVTTDQLAMATNNATADIIKSIESNNENIFVSFLKLVTEASNRFVKDPTQLGNCRQYRSLYLMDMDIEDNILPKWVSIMLVMFVLSRFITYFVIKTVIRARKRC